MSSLVLTVTSAGPPLMGLVLIFAIRLRFGATLDTDWFFSIVVVSTATASFVNYGFLVSQAAQASKAMQNGIALLAIWFAYLVNGLILVVPSALVFGWYYAGSVGVVCAVSISTLAVLHLQLLRSVEGKFSRSILAGYVWPLSQAICIFIFNTGVTSRTLYVSSLVLLMYVIFDLVLTSKMRISDLELTCLVCRKKVMAALMLISPLILLGSAEAAMAKYLLRDGAYTDYFTAAKVSLGVVNFLFSELQLRVMTVWGGAGEKMFDCLMEMKAVQLRVAMSAIILLASWSYVFYLQSALVLCLTGISAWFQNSSAIALKLMQGGSLGLEDAFTHVILVWITYFCVCFICTIFLPPAIALALSSMISSIVFFKHFHLLNHK